MQHGEKEKSAKIAAGLGWYYVYGLYLYGAAYNQERQTLEDIHPRGPIGFEMPMLRLVVESRDTPKDSPSTSSRELLQTGFAQHK